MSLLEKGTLTKFDLQLPGDDDFFLNFRSLGRWQHPFFSQWEINYLELSFGNITEGFFFHFDLNVNSYEGSFETAFKAGDLFQIPKPSKSKLPNQERNRIGPRDSMICLNLMNVPGEGLGEVMAIKGDLGHIIGQKSIGSREANSAGCRAGVAGAKELEVSMVLLDDEVIQNCEILGCVLNIMNRIKGRFDTGNPNRSERNPSKEVIISLPEGEKVTIAKWFDNCNDWLQPNFGLIGTTRC